MDAVIKLSLGMAAIEQVPLRISKRSVNAADELGARPPATVCPRRQEAHRRHRQKYIHTMKALDFAMMYIPAENVYYGIIVRNEGSDGKRSSVCAQAAGHPDLA